MSVEEITLAKRIQMFEESSIYPVVSPEFCNGRAVTDVVAAIMAGGAMILQLRAKHLPDQELYELAEQCRKLTAGRLLIIDDRVDIALAAGADGVHLGQSDLPVRVAKEIAPSLLIGASTHNPDEILQAQKDGCGYLNIGPVYPTQTKEVPTGVVGLKNMLEWRKLVKCPYSVMGGIKEHHLDELVAAGIRHIAMVTEITQAGNIKEKVQRMQSSTRNLSGQAHSFDIL